MKIILDAMGGDNAPAEILKGAAAAVAANWPELAIIAVGDEARIRTYMGETDDEATLVRNFYPGA